MAQVVRFLLVASCCFAVVTIITFLIGFVLAPVIAGFFAILLFGFAVAEWNSNRILDNMTKKEEK